MRGFGEAVEAVIAEIYRRFRGGRRILIGPARSVQQILPIGPGPSTQSTLPIRSMRAIGVTRFLRKVSGRRKIKIR
jgi:hypothetical protein